MMEGMRNAHVWIASEATTLPESTNAGVSAKTVEFTDLNDTSPMTATSKREMGKIEQNTKERNIRSDVVKRWFVSAYEVHVLLLGACPADQSPRYGEGPRTWMPPETRCCYIMRCCHDRIGILLVSSVYLRALDMVFNITHRLYTST